MKITEPEAPSVLSVAMVSVLPSSQVRTAAETPTPPTASPARPISTRKEPSRSTKRPTPGAPLRRSDQRNPLASNCATASARSALRSASGASRSR